MPVASLWIGIPMYVLFIAFIAIFANVPIDIISYAQTRIFVNKLSVSDRHMLQITFLILDFVVGAMLPVLLFMIIFLIFKSAMGGNITESILNPYFYYDAFSLYYKDIIGFDLGSEMQSGAVPTTVALTSLFWSFLLTLFVVFSYAAKGIYLSRGIFQKTFSWHSHDFILSNPITFIGEYAAVGTFITLNIVEIFG